MRRRTMLEVLWPETIFDEAIHNYAVSWTNKSTFIITKRWLAPIKASTKMFRASWFHPSICHFAFNWWTFAIKRRSKVHYITIHISFIKRHACQNLATIMIYCKWCHMLIFHICATISLLKTRNSWTWEFWRNHTHFIQILHFIFLCKYLNVVIRCMWTTFSNNHLFLQWFDGDIFNIWPLRNDFWAYHVLRCENESNATPTTRCYEV